MHALTGVATPAPGQSHPIAQMPSLAQMPAIPTAQPTRRAARRPGLSDRRAHCGSQALNRPIAKLAAALLPGERLGQHQDDLRE